jgi:uncharacterized protein
LNDTVNNEDAALQGARDIIAEWINDIFVRKQLRRLYERSNHHKPKEPKKEKKALKIQPIF